jgi:glycosyltransferase involved in cell wall biosynthesis
LNRPQDVLIYHHSIGCEWAVRAVERFPGRVVVKYHNVTPAKFFAQLNPEIARGCEQGIRQLRRLTRTTAHFWADSDYNAQELYALQPRGSVHVLPPFHQADTLLETEPDYHAAVGLDDWGTNLLVVGRLVPNKNIPLAIDTLREYRRRYDPQARLVIVGDRPVPSHAGEIERQIRASGLEDAVLITGKITVAQLKTMYLCADALLLTSHHEGFCVPLIEAMGQHLPVVAVRNAAIPYTGGNVVHYAPAEALALADQLQQVLQPGAAPLAAARARYDQEFSTRAITTRFQELWQTLLAS